MHHSHTQQRSGALLTLDVVGEADAFVRLQHDVIVVPRDLQFGEAVRVAVELQFVALHQVLGLGVELVDVRHRCNSERHSTRGYTLHSTQ